MEILMERVNMIIATMAFYGSLLLTGIMYHANGLIYYRGLFKNG